MVERRNQDAARLLVRRRGVGTLATSMADGGAPYASLVTYACDHQGQPIFLFSTLSDHTQNILVDNLASLLVEDAVGKRNPQIGPRLSLMGRVKQDTSPASRARFLARHPDAAMYAGFGDFGIYRMTVERAHYVGGFARAIWFEAKHVLTPKKIAKEMITKYSFGGGTINDTTVHFVNHRLPFGGVGESGIGSYHGKLTFDTFSHSKGVVTRYNWLDLTMRYAPYTGKLEKFRTLLKL